MVCPEASWLRSQKVYSMFNSVEFFSGRFSTLGGNNSNRAARSKSEELVLVMRS